MNNRSKSAAQYVRMSTDQQDLSIEMQKSSIEEFSKRAGLQIVESYEDAGRSGMTIRARDGMKRLVRDVTDPQCQFTTVLVYDVSRWGRFQDTDASAYWEYHCHLHGVRVVYVAEAFDQYSGPLGTVVKTLKRAMAAEYSRELAVKVRAGQHKVAAMGYSVGGQPAIGLVRQAITREGELRTILKPGERKAVQSDRIRLAPGSPEDVALLQRIFKLYAKTTISIAQLVIQLGSEGLVTNKGRPFTRRSLEGLFRCEAFIGNYVWAKRMNTPTGVKARPQSEQIRMEGALTPIISRDLWEEVQQKLSANAKPKRDPGEMISSLRSALAVKPDMTAADLAGLGCAPAQTYLKAFGGMEAAFAMAGRTNFEQVYGWSRQRSEQTKAMTRELQVSLSEAFRRSGLQNSCNHQSYVITLEGGIGVQLSLAWKRSFTKSPAWFVSRRRLSKSDWRLLILMSEAGGAEHLYLVPEDHRATFPMLIRTSSFGDIADFKLASMDEVPEKIKRGLV